MALKVGLLLGVLVLWTVLLINSADGQEACTVSGNVRLLWGAGPWEGNVQICHNGVWGWVCQNSFYTNEAKVVCRQLGFNATGAVYRRYAYFGWPDPSSPIWLDQLGCHGSESTLLSCPRPKAIGDASCNHNALAAVVCQSGGTCTNNAIRLVRNNTGTPLRSQGRVEVCHNQTWGSVCDTAWGTPDAKVACGQLGFSSSVAASYCCAKFGPGYGSVWLNNLGCTGSVGSLFSCPHDPIGSGSCAHTHDAGVGCRGEVKSSCTNGQVKLYRPYGEGPTNDGLALYCNNSQWVAFCDDGWSCHNARLICKKLGFAGALNTRSENFYGYYKAMDHYRFYCRSSDNDLSTCSYTYRSSCTSLNDQIGVICYSSVSGSECTNGHVRLQNGTVPSEGRVEYCYEGFWTPLCSMNGTTAALICNQLGYNSSLATVVDDQRFNRTNRRSVLNYLSCSPSSPSLAQCNAVRKGSSCFVSVSKCSTEVGLRCHNTASGTCTDGQIRLVNGTLAQEGRLEVCLNGIWGSVCQSGFGQVDAYVLCKAMGYNGQSPNVYYHSKYGESSGPIMYSNMNCKGWETSIQECAKNTNPNIVCSPQNTIGILCKDDCNDGDVRLVGGAFDNEGTVEVCMDNIWGLVSDAGWNMNDSMVVCRQLGHTVGTFTPILNSQYGKPNNMIRLKAVKCAGNELKLIDCSSTQLSLWAGRKQLATTSVAGVDCKYDVPTDPPCVKVPDQYQRPGAECYLAGMVRLMNGNQPATGGVGRLDYCANGYWSPVCKISPYAASLACRNFSYTEYSWAAIIETGEFGTLRNYSIMDSINCNGTENTLTFVYGGCPASYNWTCSPYCASANLGVRCFNRTAPAACSPAGAVRLVDGVIENEGRVEVCVNGVWGAVCDQGWDKTDANIVCKQLGLPDTEPIVLSNSEFGAGQYPIVYSNVSCRGWENRLADCTKQVYPMSACSRSNTAGVLCGYACNDGDVRLTGGPFSNEGSIEVCFQNIWGLIADTNWNQLDAQVVCRQLGYQEQGSVSVTGSAYGKPNKTIHMNNVACDGSEDKLAQCSYDTISLSQGKRMLSSASIAGVKCYTPDRCVQPPTGGTDCVDGTLRLTGGQASDGNLQYCYHGRWSPFCTLGPNEATVACRQLSFTNYEMTAIFDDGRFGSSSNTSFFQHFNCSTNLAATKLTNCDLVDSCQSTCKNAIGLRCYESANCDNGQVRLMGGNTDTEGRLEVCYNNVWGSVCSTNFDVTDAYVVCKELGLGISEPTVYTSSHYGDGDGAIVYSNTSCKGYEYSINQCTKQLYGSFTCSRQNVVGIACQEGCTNGAVRLINGSSSNEGTVEVCNYNTWGLVADGGWSSTEAQVVCRQLNLQGGDPVTGSFYGKPNAPILVSNTDCTGNEQTIRDCHYTQLTEDDSVNLYSRATVAGVRCGARSTHHAPSPSTMAIIFLTLIMVFFMAVSIGLIVLLVYLWQKSSKSGRFSIMALRSSDHSDGVSNPLAQMSNGEHEDEDSDHDDDEEMIQLMNNN